MGNPDRLALPQRGHLINRLFDPVSAVDREQLQVLQKVLALLPTGEVSRSGSTAMADTAGYQHKPKEAVHRALTCVH